jgi:cell division protease FtsH
LFLEDLSAGSAQDLERATEIARNLVERLGMAEQADVAVFLRRREGPDLSDGARAQLDGATVRILDEQRDRARRLLEDNRELVIALRDMLIEHKVVDRKTLVGMKRKTGGDDG